VTAAARVRQIGRAAVVAFVVCLPVSISGAEIAMGIALVAAMLQEALGARRLARLPMRVPLLALFAVLATSSLAGGLGWTALDAYRELWLVGVYVATIALVDDTAQATRLVRLLVACATVTAIYGIVQHVTGIDLYRQLLGARLRIKPYEHDPRRFAVIGFFPNYLTYAHSLMAPLGWAVATWLAASGHRGARWRAALCASVMTVALVLSTARGAWLAAGAMALVAVGVGRQRALAMLVTAAALASVLFWVSPGLRAEGRSIIDGRANAARAAIYAANLEAIADHPVLGVGFGNYDHRMIPYYERHGRADRRSHAHNSFLQIAVEAGLVGLAVFTGLFILAFARGWRTIAHCRAAPDGRGATAIGAVLGLVGFLVGGLTQDTFGDSECVMAMWFALAVLMIAWRETLVDEAAAHPAR
jgi:O-antigen ligase